MKIDGEGPADAEIGEYLNRLNELKTGIKEVQVYTTARKTASENVRALDDVRIDAIVKKIQATGINATGYYGVE